jgi:CDP-diacylglycerol---glycerol-3-phosphate 3-phosphatidyltransferase
MSGSVLTPTVGWRRWFPNALTVTRLVVAAAFFILLAVWSYPQWMLTFPPDNRVNVLHPVKPYLIAAALFGLAALTDALDGPLARRWHVVSKFGRVMDPFADKVLVVGGFIMLCGPRFNVDIPTATGELSLQVSGIHPWMVVVILGRELLVTSIRAVAEESGKDFSANFFGKVKMVVQACVIPIILIILGITDAAPATWGRLIIDIAAWLTVSVTVLSGIPYVIKGVAILSEPKP